MDASGILASRSTAVPSEQESKIIPAEVVFAICACAGVSVVGITRDLVIFQPHITSLCLPLGTFEDAAAAIAAIKTKLAEVGR